MKEITLTKGYVALVDDEDYEWLNQYKWHADVRKNTKNVYAKRTTWVNRKVGGVLMHRQILGILDKPEIEGEHKDRNGLNNQRENIRQATRSQNLWNTSSAKNATSKYLGVYWYKTRSQWKSEIMKDRKRKCLGYYQHESDAAMAYNTAAKELHGEFANLNQIE